jgi:hypothetical protein
VRNRPKPLRPAAAGIRSPGANSSDDSGMTNIVRRMALRLRKVHQATVAYSLRTIPELSDRVTIAEKLRQGAQAIGNRVVAENLLFAVQYVTHSSVAGESAEVGCTTGRTPRVIAAPMQLVDSDKELHLFESFAGAPCFDRRAGSREHRRSIGRLGPGGVQGHFSGGVESEVQPLPAGPGNTNPRGMVFRNPAVVAAGNQLCDATYRLRSLPVVVRRARLRLRQSEGAIILFEDWNCSRASNDHDERRAWRRWWRGKASRAAIWGHMVGPRTSSSFMIMLGHPPAETRFSGRMRDMWHAGTDQ